MLVALVFHLLLLKLTSVHSAKRSIDNYQVLWMMIQSFLEMTILKVFCLVIAITYS